MRILTIIALVFGATMAVGDDKKDEQAVSSKDCSSCTARHKSLQALQKARAAPKEEEPKSDPDKSDE